VVRRREARDGLVVEEVPVSIKGRQTHVGEPADRQDLPVGSCPCRPVELMVVEASPVDQWASSQVPHSQVVQAELHHDRSPEASAVTKWVTPPTWAASAADVRYIIIPPLLYREDREQRCGGRCALIEGGTGRVVLRADVDQRLQARWGRWISLRIGEERLASARWPKKGRRASAPSAMKPGDQKNPRSKSIADPEGAWSLFAPSTHK
jgi:hypothetical protein